MMKNKKNYTKILIFLLKNIIKLKININRYVTNEKYDKFSHHIPSN